MKWNRIEVSWTQLKDKFSFGPFWSSDGDTEDYDLIDAEIPTVGQSMRDARSPFVPTIGESGASFLCISAPDRMRQGEFNYV